MELTHSVAPLQLNECQRNVTYVLMMKSWENEEFLVVERQAMQKAFHVPGRGGGDRPMSVSSKFELKNVSAFEGQKKTPSHHLHARRQLCWALGMSGIKLN